MKIEAIESMGLFSSHILTMSKAKTQVDLLQANLFQTSMSGVCAAIDWLMSKAQHDGYADVSEETRNTNESFQAKDPKLQYGDPARSIDASMSNCRPIDAGRGPSPRPSYPGYFNEHDQLSRSVLTKT